VAAAAALRLAGSDAPHAPRLIAEFGTALPDHRPFLLAERLAAGHVAAAADGPTPR
jgi:hypothetical protein